MLERKIVNDHVFIFFNFGAEAVRVSGLTQISLRRVFGSGEGEEIAPSSVLVCEITEQL
jgi:hypothetical protein